MAILACLCLDEAKAKVAGPCVNCNTMHNSQDDAGVVTDSLDGAFA